MRHRRTLAAALVAATLGGAVTSAAAVSSPVTGAPPCSWYGETDQRDVNIGAPDTDAYYVMSPLPTTPGLRVVVSGTYPRARYFSLHVYDDQAAAIGSLYDAQIAPDRGSANPFAGPSAARTGRRWSVTVVQGGRPRHPARNTLYAGTPTGPADVRLLVYRIYVPTTAGSPSGGVAWPQVTVETSSGQPIVTEGACSTTPPAFGSYVWAQAAAADYPAGAPTPAVAGASRIPVRQRQFGSRLGNQQNTYLATTISRQYGDLVVIHGQAPTFPDTRRGTPPYAPAQLRYWSFCTYDQYGEAGFGCAADYAAARTGGSYTYVVSDPGDRPANATAAHGVTWLPWGGTQSSAQVVYRNMLPAASFRFAAQRITSPSESAVRVMGAYYPRAVYCVPATFARGGWQACFRAAGLRP